MSYIFISYVREDKDQVDRLVNELRSAGATVWLDREDLLPGQRWREAIRQAIMNGMFFMACFSDNYLGRNSTYMNEEITLALERLRTMRYDRTWFIPVLLSDCSVPEREIGGGETLRDIQWVSLHHDWRSGVEKILRVVKLQADEHNGALGSTREEHKSAEAIKKVPPMQIDFGSPEELVLAPSSTSASSVGMTYLALLSRCLQDLSREDSELALSELQEGANERTVFNRLWMEPRSHFIVRALVEAATELDSTQKVELLARFNVL